MALDGIYLHLLINELEVLKGARLEKLSQPSRLEFLLQFRSRSGSHKLLVSTGGSAPKICLTDR
ncbi:MAG: NFACT family protein, partial [Oscillospiraceae bacterium]|nr:NFACT family protein [Oscillospiraceae bacterium]